MFSNFNLQVTLQKMFSNNTEDEIYEEDILMDIPIWSLDQKITCAHIGLALIIVSIISGCALNCIACCHCRRRPWRQKKVCIALSLNKVLRI